MIFQNLYSCSASPRDSSPRDSFEVAFSPGERVRVPLAGKEKVEKPQKNKVDIRTYFPETWLWDLYPIQ